MDSSTMASFLDRDVSHYLYAKLVLHIVKYTSYKGPRLISSTMVTGHFFHHVSKGNKIRQRTSTATRTGGGLMTGYGNTTHHHHHPTMQPKLLSTREESQVMFKLQRSLAMDYISPTLHLTSRDVQTHVTLLHLVVSLGCCQLSQSLVDLGGPCLLQTMDAHGRRPLDVALSYFGLTTTYMDSFTSDHEEDGEEMDIPFYKSTTHHCGSRLLALQSLMLRTLLPSTGLKNHHLTTATIEPMMNKRRQKLRHQREQQPSGPSLLHAALFSSHRWIKHSETSTTHHPHHQTTTTTTTTGSAHTGATVADVHSQKTKGFLVLQGSSQDTVSPLHVPTSSTVATGGVMAGSDATELRTGGICKCLEHSASTVTPLVVLLKATSIKDCLQPPSPSQQQQSSTSQYQRQLVNPLLPHACQVGHWKGKSPLHVAIELDDVPSVVHILRRMAKEDDWMQEHPSHTPPPHHHHYNIQSIYCHIPHLLICSCCDAFVLTIALCSGAQVSSQILLQLLLFPFKQDTLIQTYFIEAEREILHTQLHHGWMYAKEREKQKKKQGKRQRSHKRQQSRHQQQEQQQQQQGPTLNIFHAFALSGLPCTYLLMMAQLLDIQSSTNCSITSSSICSESIIHHHHQTTQSVWHREDQNDIHNLKDSTVFSESQVTENLTHVRHNGKMTLTPLVSQLLLTLTDQKQQQRPRRERRKQKKRKEQIQHDTIPSPSADSIPLHEETSSSFSVSPCHPKNVSITFSMGDRSISSETVRPIPTTTSMAVVEGRTKEVTMELETKQKPLQHTRVPMTGVSVESTALTQQPSSHVSEGLDDGSITNRTVATTTTATATVTDARSPHCYGFSPSSSSCGYCFTSSPVPQSTSLLSPLNKYPTEMPHNHHETNMEPLTSPQHHHHQSLQDRIEGRETDEGILLEQHDNKQNKDSSCHVKQWTSPCLSFQQDHHQQQQEEEEDDNDDVSHFLDLPPPLTTNVTDTRSQEGVVDKMVQTPKNPSSKSPPLLPQSTLQPYPPIPPLEMYPTLSDMDFIIKSPKHYQQQHLHQASSDGMHPFARAASGVDERALSSSPSMYLLAQSQIPQHAHQTLQAQPSFLSYESPHIMDFGGASLDDLTSRAVGGTIFPHYDSFLDPQQLAQSQLQPSQPQQTVMATSTATTTATHLVTTSTTLSLPERRRLYRQLFLPEDGQRSESPACLSHSQQQYQHPHSSMTLLSRPNSSKREGTQIQPFDSETFSRSATLQQPGGGGGATAMSVSATTLSEEDRFQQSTSSLIRVPSIPPCDQHEHLMYLFTEEYSQYLPLIQQHLSSFDTAQQHPHHTAATAPSTTSKNDAMNYFHYQLALLLVTDCYSPLQRSQGTSKRRNPCNTQRNMPWSSPIVLALTTKQVDLTSMLLSLLLYAMLQLPQGSTFSSQLEHFFATKPDSFTFNSLTSAKRLQCYSISLTNDTNTTTTSSSSSDSSPPLPPLIMTHHQSMTPHSSNRTVSFTLQT